MTAFLLVPLLLGQKNLGPGFAVDKTYQIITVDSNKRKLKLAGKGGGLTVNGNGNRIVVSGRLGVVRVNGNHNVVEVDQAQWLDASGNDNRVTWKRGFGGKPPRVTSLGNRNWIIKG